MADMTNIKDRIRETIYPNGQGAISAAEHQAMLLEMVDEINNKKQDYIPGGQPFSAEGRYPALSVGFADNLSGHGESIPAEFYFRATGGRSIADGVARIKRIKGNSVVWNQWAKPFEEAYEKPYHDGITYNGNKVTIDNWRAYNPFRFDIKFSTAKDHLYLVLLNYANSNPDQLIYIEFGGENPIYKNIGNIAYFHRNIIYNNAYKDAITLYVSNTMEGTITLSDLQVIDLTKMFGAGNEPTTIEEYNARKPIVADEFAYNEGEVIHMNVESIKSVGDNAWDEEWENGYIESTTGEEIAYDQWFRCKNYIKILPNTQYYAKKPSGVFMLPIYYDEEKRFIKSEDVFYTGGEGGNFTTPNASYMRFYCNIPKYNHDIMITLVHSGWKQDTDAGYQPYWQDIRDTSIIGKYFTDGMKSAGDAHDEIRFNKATQRWEWVSRIAAIDMGSLDWFEYLNDYGIMCYSALKWDGIQDATSNQYAHLLTKLYATQKWDDLYVGAAEGIAFAETLRVVDSSVSSLAEFKAKVQGVTLYYELTEPIIREMSEPFNPDYRVADFGTEEAISSRPSAPFAADIIYQFNAVDMIRELWGMVQTLQAKL